MVTAGCRMRNSNSRPCSRASTGPGAGGAAGGGGPGGGAAAGLQGAERSASRARAPLLSSPTSAMFPGRERASVPASGAEPAGREGGRTGRSGSRAGPRRRRRCRFPRPLPPAPPAGPGRAPPRFIARGGGEPGCGLRAAPGARRRLQAPSGHRRARSAVTRAGAEDPCEPLRAGSARRVAPQGWRGAAGSPASDRAAPQLRARPALLLRALAPSPRPPF